MLEFATNSSSIGETLGFEVEQWQEAQKGPDFMTVLWHQTSPSEVEFEFFCS